MPFVIKSHPRRIGGTSAPTVTFTEWAYEHADPQDGEAAVWFTAETSGGFGLFALGRIQGSAIDAGKSATGKDLVEVTAVFHTFEPVRPLGKADFSILPRIGSGPPIQELNRRLYINAHAKIASINAETFDFLEERFR